MEVGLLRYIQLRGNVARTFTLRARDSRVILQSCVNGSIKHVDTVTKVDTGIHRVLICVLLWLEPCLSYCEEVNLQMQQAKFISSSSAMHSYSMTNQFMAHVRLSFRIT